MRKARLGRAPSTFGGSNDKIASRIAALLAAEPEATKERRDQLIMQALNDRRTTVYFFDATFSVPKSVSLLQASLQVRAIEARDEGRAQEAEQWTARAQVVWNAIMTANQAMLDYLQREAGYSRAGYHSKRSGRFAASGPRIMASLRNLVITILRLAGAASITAAVCHHARRPTRSLRTIMNS